MAASRGLGVGGTVALAAIVALVVGLLAGIGGYTIGRAADASSGTSSSSDSGNGTTAGGTVATSAVPSAPGSIASALQGTVSDIAARTLPAVVSIIVKGSQGGGSGSGFVLRDDGYIITNKHVVDAVPGGTITVEFSDGVRIPGTVVGKSADYDLAVVKVARTGLPVLGLGDSDKVRVGDAAIAIGAPLGLEGTVTSGIVSALNRPVTTEGDSGSTAPASFINAIQTDAAINPGNSGGPLLDGAGRVIGVNSAIATLTGGAESGSIGLGFSIPINSARRVVDQLIATGSSTTPVLGVTLDMQFADDGAKVQKVTPGSAADAAGIQPGDIVTSVNGRRVHDGTELVVAVRAHAPNERIDVTYTRGGVSHTASLTLGEQGKK